MMKNILATSLLWAGLVFSIQAHAWEEIGTDEESHYSVDLNNMKYLNKIGTQRQAWFKVRALEDSAIMKKGQYMMSLNSFDCANARFRIDSNIVYSDQKKVVSQMDQSSGWLDTVPESLFDQLAYVVCSHD